MSVSTIVVSQNPIVARPKPASFSLTLYGDGLTRFVPSSETHALIDSGWFLNARFDIEGPEDQLNEIFSNGLARDVKIYDEFGLTAWEGLITTFILRTTTTGRLVSLNNIANRTILRVNVDGNPHAKPAAQNDTDSQNQYGIIERVLHLTKTKDGIDNANNMLQVAIDNISDPYKMAEMRNLINDSIPHRRAILSVICTGYAFYLVHRTYNKLTANTEANISTIISNIITDKGDFVASTSVETNTQQSNQFYNDDEMSWDIIVELSGESDTNDNKYIVGMNEDRNFYYRQRAAESLDNIQLTRDGLGIVRHVREGTISPIRIVPDQYMRDTSIMNDPGTAYSKIRLDPQVSYIERVVYRNADDEAQIYSVRRTNRARRLKKALQKAALAEV